MIALHAQQVEQEAYLMRSPLDPAWRPLGEPVDAETLRASWCTACGLTHADCVCKDGPAT